LAQCGISVDLISCVGVDALSDLVLDELRRTGVDLSQVQRDPEIPGGLIFVAVTPDGERTMFSHRGANTSTHPHRLRPSRIRGAQWLHVSGYALLCPPQAQALFRALVLARHSGCFISLDPGTEVARRESAAVRALLPHTTVLFVTEDESQALVGTSKPSLAISKLGSDGLPVVVLKRGERGCVLGQGSRLWHIPAFQVDAIDTTGAGDAFAAGYLAGCVRGLGLRARGVWANAVGALVASWEGGAPPEPSAIRTLLRDGLGQARWQSWRSEIEAVLGALPEDTDQERVAP
jgi:ribokinase